MSAMRFRYRRGLSGHGGYRGKERLNRDRSRASRCQARQLIEDYLDVEDEPACRIRIGHRSEFIPSAETEFEVEAQQEQLSLPLERDHTFGPVAEHRAEPVLRLHEPEPETRAAVEPVSQQVEEQEPAVVGDQTASSAQVETQKRPAYEWFSDRRPVRAKTFQRGHFLYGCALGTAAAAALLAMLRVAFM